MSLSGESDKATDNRTAGPRGGEEFELSSLFTSFGGGEGLSWTIQKLAQMNNAKLAPLP